MEIFTGEERREMMKAFKADPACSFEPPEDYLIDAYVSAYNSGYTEDQIKCIIQTEYTGKKDSMITDGQYMRWLPHFYMAVRKLNQERFKNGGLLKYKTQGLEERMLLAVSCGASKEDAAKMLGVPPGVLIKWMDEDEEFKSNLEHATGIANSMVQQALFKRAVGYTRYSRSITKTEHEFIQKRGVKVTEDGGVEEQGDTPIIDKTRVETSKEEAVPPSVDAIKFWLINRNSANFNLTGNITDVSQKSKILEAIHKMSEMTEADYVELKNDQKAE